MEYPVYCTEGGGFRFRDPAKFVCQQSCWYSWCLKSNKTTFVFRVILDNQTFVVPKQYKPWFPVNPNRRALEFKGTSLGFLCRRVRRFGFGGFSPACVS